MPPADPSSFPALHFTGRLRDTQGTVIQTPLTIRPQSTAVVIIDPWNFHWCMTAAHRVSALAPRWNKALDGLRKLGVPVLWAPTEAASQYAGTPQRERAAAIAPVPMPGDASFEIPFTVTRGRCMCGPGITCPVNYGLDGICAAIHIGPDDWIVSGAREVFSICRRRDIRHVIYMGLHTNICLAGRPEGITTTRAAGITCIVARDMVDAWTFYEPGRHTPDDGTAQANDDLERAGIPTIHLADELRRAGRWNDAEPVDAVRITPWGVENRPYLFDGSTVATLTVPNQNVTEIRYTLDGSEPTVDSLCYRDPITLRESATLRALAFRDGRKVSLEGCGRFERLPAEPPPPQIFLDELEPVHEDYPHWYSAWHPVINRAFGGTPLRIRDRSYTRGIGMRAPANVRYSLEPKYDRFVARVCVDSQCVQFDADQYGFEKRPANDPFDGHGCLLAQEPNLRFRVFIDGHLAAQSPVLRMGHEPWRFDVKIPDEARQINLVAMDGGRKSPLNLGDWIDAGFVLKR